MQGIPVMFHGVFHTVIDFLCRLLARPDQASGGHNIIDNRKSLFLSYDKRMGLWDITKAVHCEKSTVAENCFHIRCYRMRRAVHSPHGWCRCLCEEAAQVRLEAVVDNRWLPLGRRNSRSNQRPIPTGEATWRKAHATIIATQYDPQEWGMLCRTALWQWEAKQIITSPAERRTNEKMMAVTCLPWWSSQYRRLLRDGQDISPSSRDSTHCWPCLSAYMSVFALLMHKRPSWKIIPNMFSEGSLPNNKKKIVTEQSLTVTILKLT